MQGHSCAVTPNVVYEHTVEDLRLYFVELSRGDDDDDDDYSDDCADLEDSLEGDLFGDIGTEDE